MEMRWWGGEMKIMDLRWKLWGKVRETLMVKEGVATTNWERRRWRIEGTETPRQIDDGDAAYIVKWEKGEGTSKGEKLWSVK